jgi:hypothetical protein
MSFVRQAPSGGSSAGAQCAGVPVPPPASFKLFNLILSRSVVSSYTKGSLENAWFPGAVVTPLFEEAIMKVARLIGASALVAASFPAEPATAQQGQPQQPMGFFVTSVGLGDGGNLGGLAGADQHCQTLAQAAGAGNRTWRAYLSTTASGNQPAVNARDRIGAGPWYNARGALITQNVADLHGDIERDRNNVRKPTALNEKGEEVNGVGDQPNIHDILTGSNSLGRALEGDPQMTTCNNWTSNAAGTAGGRAMVGHHDRLGGANVSWNAVHLTSGCSQQNLVATGGKRPARPQWSGGALPQVAEPGGSRCTHLGGYSVRGLRRLPLCDACAACVLCVTPSPRRD